MTRTIEDRLAAGAARFVDRRVPVPIRAMLRPAEVASERYRQMLAMESTITFAKARRRSARVASVLAARPWSFNGDGFYCTFDVDDHELGLILDAVLAGQGVPSWFAEELGDGVLLNWLLELEKAITADRRHAAQLAAFRKRLTEQRATRTRQEPALRYRRATCQHHPPPRAPLTATPIAAHAPPARPHADITTACGARAPALIP